MRRMSKKYKPASSEVVWEARVVHLGVSALAQVGVVSPELLVSLEQEIDLWVVQPRIDVLVHVPVLRPQLGAVVRPSLAGELAVEDQDVPLLLGVAVVPGWVVVVVVGVKERCGKRGWCLYSRCGIVAGRSLGKGFLRRRKESIKKFVILGKFASSGQLFHRTLFSRFIIGKQTHTSPCCQFSAPLMWPPSNSNLYLRDQNCYRS